MADTVWVVVCDGGSSRTFLNRGNKASSKLETLEEFEVDNPPTREQGTDKPGRFDDPVHGRSAVQDTDWHEQEKQRFAERVVDHINQAALKGAFSQLLLYADPSTLGRLRQQLHQEAIDRVVFEKAVDLTNVPVSEIEDRVTEALLPII